VLTAPYTADRSRQQVWVMGSVGHPGPVNIPGDDVLTLWNALWEAGGLSPQADATRVQILRHDVAGGNNSAKMEVNVEQIYLTGKGDVVMQPGDFIIVPQKGEANGYVTITGAVHSPGIMPLPVGSNTTVSQAILQAGGFNEWGDDEVKLVHYDEKGKRTDKWVEVGEVLRGDRSKDATLESGDLVIVYQKWINW
jgi:protein involved in polysaccharide export with SLBB domain